MMTDDYNPFGSDLDYEVDYKGPIHNRNGDVIWLGRCYPTLITQTFIWNFSDEEIKFHGLEEFVKIFLPGRYHSMLKSSN